MRLLLSCTACFCLSVALVKASAAQETNPSTIAHTRILGNLDSDVPVPPSALPANRIDAGAIAAINAFLTRLPVSTAMGARADGTFSDPLGSAHDAMLVYSSDGSMRLDVQDAPSQRSIRIANGHGTIAESSGRKHALPPATAGIGIFVTPSFLLVQSQSTRASFVDQGSVTINSQLLHRVSLSLSLEGAPQQVVDLYFDAATGLLSISAANVQLETCDSSRYFQVIHYADYRSDGNVSLPHSYRSTLNGQPQWTLSLQTFEINPAIETGTFHF